MSAVQCWTSLEEFFGVVPCTLMSMMSNDLLPSACEVDVCGTLSMYALALASETPSALLDWNNNYGDDPDKAVCFHCSNLPKHFFETARMDYQEIIAGTVGKDNTFGTMRGPGPGRADELRPLFDRRPDRQDPRLRGRGTFHRRSAATPSAAPAWSRFPHLQELLHYICEHGFEHHVAANFSHVGRGAARGDDEVFRVGCPLASANLARALPA